MGEVVDLEKHRRRKMQGLPRSRSLVQRRRETGPESRRDDGAPAAKGTGTPAEIENAERDGDTDPSGRAD